MYWANFLHFYQPPTQKPFWIHKITAEAYRPILAGLKKQSKNKLTLNVSGILLEHLERCGETDVIELLRDLLRSGQIELTGSAKYHPLLPFLPKDEVVRQIKLNEETLAKYFGGLWRRGGFFPPEMAFSKELGEIVAELGYRWIIVDEFSFPSENLALDYSKTYTLAGTNGFYVFFRERRMSWVILSGQVGTGNLLLESLGERLKRREYLLTAMDGETFGHHRPGLEKLLFEMYGYRGIETVLISDLPKLFPKPIAIDPRPSTWALMEKDLERKKPFSRWLDEDNIIHKTQWELTRLALNEMKKADPKSAGYGEARMALDRALHSDQYWWASARPWWSIEMIERGAKELLAAVAAIPEVSASAKHQAEELYKSIIFTAFDWQREGIVDELAHKEDEDIRQRTDAGMPKLPEEEIEKMIAVLNKQLEDVVRNQEFERAAQIRDRVAELRRYASDAKTPKLSKEGSVEF